MWDADADRLGLGPLADFCGAYVENAFSETQETWIDLTAGETVKYPQGDPVASEPAIASHPLPEIAKDKNRSWWVQTSFHLPFMYTIGRSRRSTSTRSWCCRLSGNRACESLRPGSTASRWTFASISIPATAALSCFYADLVGSAAVGGENRLVVHFEAK